MKNEVAMKPFPENLFNDLGRQAPTETPDDFTATFMYVLYNVATARDIRIILMRYRNGKSFDDIATEFGITRQRAHSVVQEVLGRITGDHVAMLEKGMKKYAEDLLVNRVNSLMKNVGDDERVAIWNDAYETGYVDGKAGAKKQSMETYANVNVDTLGLSNRAYNVCTAMNIRTLADLLNVGDKLMSFRNFGAKCFHEICDIMKSYGIKPEEYYPRSVEKFGLV